MDFSIKMELSALLTLVVLFVFHHEKSRQRTEGYHLFSASLVFSMLTILVDVLSTVAIYHAHHVPLWLNVALVCAYFILLALALSLTAMYAFCILLAYSPAYPLHQNRLYHHPGPVCRHDPVHRVHPLDRLAVPL